MSANTIFGVVLMALAINLLSACNVNNESRYYLFRHAEKVKDGTKDPSLTSQGKERAQRIAALLKDQPIKKIYTTDYQRTRDTIKPLAESIKVEVVLYDPAQLRKFAHQLQQQKGTYVIVGHSNTTPEVTELLSQQRITPMSDDEYSDIYLVTITKPIYKVEKLSSD